MTGFDGLNRLRRTIYACLSW